MDGASFSPLAAGVVCARYDVRMDEDARARAAARAQWPGRKTRLADEGAWAPLEATAAERVAMVHRLTLDAWAMSGKRIPDYARADAPGRMVRGRGAT